MDDLIDLSYIPIDGLEKWVSGEPYRRFLYHLILKTRPEAVVELGTYLGQTSALMAAACQKVGAICIGVDSAGKNSGIVEVEKTFPCYRFLFCDTLGAVEVASTILGSRKVGVLFQDSSHHAEVSWQEWLYWRHVLAQGATWVCDDITPAFKMPDEPRGMEEYFQRLPGKKKLYPGLHIGNVIGVVSC